MEYRVLGPLEARSNGRALDLGGPKQRAVLAVLLLHANEVVSVDALIDAIWGENAPETAAGAIHGSVSRLRKALEPEGAPYEILRTHPPGYTLAVAPAELDRERFSRLAAEGRAALARGDASRAATTLTEALAVWRGPALADLAYTLADRTEIDRLEEERLAALEDRIDAELALGRHAALAPELETLVHRHPLRERLRGQLMLALYRSGRQADALEAYRAGSRLLDEELGLEPTPELRDLERRILVQDPGLTQTADGSPIPRTRPRGRRAWLAAALVALVPAAALIGIAIAASRSDDPPRVDRVVPNGVGAIDPASNRLERSIAVGSYPEDLAVSGDSVWVANAGDHTVSRVDAGSGEVTTTKGLRGAPVSLTVKDETVWIAMSHFDQPTSLLRLGSTPNESAVHVAELTPGPGLYLPVLAKTASGVWASLDAEPDTLVVAAYGTRFVDALPDLCSPAGAGAASRTVWVACRDGRLVRLDERTRRRLSVTQVATSAGGLAVGAGAVWLSDPSENVVWRVDPVTGRATRTVPVPGGPRALAAGYGAIWVVSPETGVVSRIDPRTNEVVARIRAGRAVDSVAIGAGRVWVAVPGEVTETH